MIPSILKELAQEISRLNSYKWWFLEFVRLWVKYQRPRRKLVLFEILKSVNIAILGKVMWQLM